MTMKTMTRRAAFDLMRALQQAANVTRDPKDPVADHRRFKYAAGKNYLRLKSIDKATEKKQRDLFVHDPAFEEYDLARRELGLKHCRKDEKGEPVLIQPNGTDPDAQPRFSMTAEGQKAFDAEHAELSKRYELALARRDAMAKAIEAIGDETVEVELHTFPFERVPVRLGGSFMASIEAMLSDLPDGP